MQTNVRSIHPHPTAKRCLIALHPGVRSSVCQAMRWRDDIGRYGATLGREAQGVKPEVGCQPVRAPSLQVQTVLYDNDPGQVERFLRSVATACLFAQSRGVLGDVSLAIGDSSAVPVISEPESLQQLRAHPFETITYVHFGANLGSAGGHNRLFSSLAQDLVVVCNPDTYASPQLLTELVVSFDEESVGIAEGRQIPLEQPKVHDPGTGDTSWASGSCFAARAAVVAAIGGFDPDLFFLYCDDVDFSWRAKLAGWRVVHRAPAVIFHDKRLTPRGDLETTDTEISYSAEAAVLLPWRYSRPDVAERNLAALEASFDERHRSAAVRLRDRQRCGALPEPIDPDHRVAQFVGPDYAVHRFSWGA